jgi:quinol monooxygenase YgiN
MQNEIYSIYHVTVDPERFSEFQTLVAQIVSATSKEPDTLTYEYVVNADHNAVHIVERYRTPGVLPHIEKTFAPFAEKFLSLVKIEKLFVYGETTPAIRAKLDGFGAIYLTPFDGLNR